jgi:hypothetical protein
MKINNLFNKLTRLRFPWPIKILVTAVVIYLVNRSLTKDQLPLLFKNVSMVPFSIVFIFGCMGFYCQVKRWQYILKLFGTMVNGPEALRTMLWGCLLAFITPGRTGEFFRGFSLPALKKNDAVVAVFIEKLFAGGTTLLAGLVCCLIFLSLKAMGCWGHAVIISGAAAVAAAAGGIFAMRKAGFVKQALERLPDFSPQQAGIIAFYSVVVHLFLLAQTSILLSMLGSNAFFSSMLIGGQAYVFMLFFPFFIANMGIREYSFGMFSACGQGVAPESGLSAVAFGASMGILIINIILPALFGLVWWVFDKKKVDA